MTIEDNRTEHDVQIWWSGMVGSTETTNCPCTRKHRLPFIKSRFSGNAPPVTDVGDPPFFCRYQTESITLSSTRLSLLHVKESKRVTSSCSLWVARVGWFARVGEIDKWMRAGGGWLATFFLWLFCPSVNYGRGKECPRKSNSVVGL